MPLTNDKLQNKLLRWYKENQRVLPWRGSHDPYLIWLSEIIMQQTRVAQGTPYYLRFVHNYPNVAALAAASEQEVLRLWQGLGYYSRARNLHHTAKQVVELWGGSFPGNYKDLLTLKGIGAYTAAAIASIAYNEAKAVLDGNVYRALARIYGIDMPINAKGAPAFYGDLAQKLLDKDNPGTFNEAMMEFGATLCTPKSPLCQRCPVQAMCKAYETGRQNVLPVKLSLKKPKDRYMHYMLIRDGEHIYLNKRGEGDIWQGLYDLPLVETNASGLIGGDTASEMLQAKTSMIKPLKKMVHKLTHQRLEIVFYDAVPEGPAPKAWQSVFTRVKVNALSQYPLPKPIELFLNDYLCNPEFW